MLVALGTMCVCRALVAFMPTLWTTTLIVLAFFFFSSRRRHTRSVSAFLLNRSSDLAVQPDIEAERKKRDEIEAGKSYCSRRFGGATCDDKSAQIYARFDKNDWRIQPAEFYRFHDAEVNTFGYF